ncbi:hypothetical protein FSP39_019746 [Pinctada imbricata]|uniref:Hemicentin-1 n=1 Tax=Pinctada imbricata TaxID=66713 RepID=A0AA88YK99_PINIB|nr:hypothetical protein FSP39_019746 [Pinctada imbricata]
MPLDKMYDNSRIVYFIVNGGWSGWSNWTLCSATCANGTQKRSRNCSNPPPSPLGVPCKGQALESRNCSSQPCPVNGGWSGWSNWTLCSATCANGTQKRSRNCSNPPPSPLGVPCKGQALESRNCNSQSCPAWTRHARFGFLTLISDPQSKQCDTAKENIGIATNLVDRGLNRGNRNKSSKSASEIVVDRRRTCFTKISYDRILRSVALCQDLLRSITFTTLSYALSRCKDQSGQS